MLSYGLERGENMNSQYIKINGRTFVIGDNSITEIESAPDIQYKLVLENVNERLIEHLLTIYTSNIAQKITNISNLKKQLKEAQDESKPLEIVKIILSSLLLLAFGPIFGTFGVWMSCEIDTWNIIEALTVDPLKFSFGISMMSLGTALFLGITVNNFCHKKQLVTKLTAKIATQESELATLEREKQMIEQYKNAKEVTPIDNITTSLEKFNKALEERIMARFQKIQSLEETRKVLTELLQGEELDALLETADLSQDEIRQAKTTLGKRMSLQQNDKANNAQSTN